MRLCLLFSFSMVMGSGVFAQMKMNRNTVFFEAGGNGLICSINYEVLLLRNYNFGIRAGMGFAPIDEGYLVVPIGINYLFKMNKPGSFVDIGFGATWSKSVERYYYGNDFYETESPMISYIPSIGFRRHTNKNFMWRINFTPVFNRDGVAPWIGFSIGKRF